jgi:hypothetical protein
MKILLAGCLRLTAFLGGCTTPEDQGLTRGDRCGVISHTSRLHEVDRLREFSNGGDSIKVTKKAVPNIFMN